MSSSAKPRTVAVSRKAKPTYRGVTLRQPATTSQFTARQIKKAVERAIAKNIDALADAK